MQHVIAHTIIDGHWHISSGLLLKKMDPFGDVVMLFFGDCIRTVTIEHYSARCSAHYYVYPHEAQTMFDDIKKGINEDRLTKELLDLYLTMSLPKLKP
jgi:hypothetical protein